MKIQILIALRALTLAACTPEFIPAPAEMSIPTATSTPFPPTFTPTLEVKPTIVLPTPSPIPTNTPIFLITPDPIQMERWQENQMVLAKSILPHIPSEIVLCEWAILGQTINEIYVWAVCDSWERVSAPAVIYLVANGAIQKVKAVGYDATRNSQIQQQFPPDVQEKIFSEITSTIDEQLKRHLDQRLGRPENPPLIILSTTQMP